MSNDQSIQKSADGIDLLLIALVALLRAEQAQLHILPVPLLLYPLHHLAVHPDPPVLFVALLYFEELPVSLERPVEVLHFLLGDDVVVVAANEHDGDVLGDSFVVLHVVLAEEGEVEAPFDLLLQEVEDEAHEGLGEVSLLVYDSSHHFLQRAEGTVQHNLVHNLVVLGSEHNRSYCSHAPPPHSQPLDLQVLIGLPQHCFGVGGLVDPIGEVAGIAVAAPHEIEGDDGYIVLGDQWKDAHYFNLTAPVAVEVEEGVVGCFVFLFEDHCADIAAVVSGNCKIDALNKASVDKLLAGTDGVDVVGVLAGSDDSLPGLFKGFPQLFHQQEIMIKCIAYNNFIENIIPPPSCASLQYGVISRRRNYLLILQYSIMTQVILAEQQIELVNIVEVVQGKLSKNFALILKRLNQHDALFAKYQSQIHQQQAHRLASIAHLQSTLQTNAHLVESSLEGLKGRIQRLEENSVLLKKQEEQGEVSIRRLNDELFNTQLQFQEKMKQKQNELSLITTHVQLLALEQNRINEEMNKKQNKVEAERIVKETQKLKDKNTHIESELKIAYHKIQKMEILNEKAERLQAKKEVEIFKEIQERVRKEIKNNFSIPMAQNGQIVAPSISNIASNTPKLSSFSPNNPLVSLSSERKSELQERGQMQSKRGSIVIEESVNGEGSGRSDFLRGNAESYLQKWGEKMRLFEVSLKEVTENLKVLNKNSNKKDARQNKENSHSSEGIKDKINEIKPEIVKLWAKLDTIEDRLSFNQRKLEEKLKTVSELTNIIKENSASKLEQKLKNLQTEVFTNIKEIRAKLEGKINQSDYDKYCLKMQQRIVQINELIYLKSDKLQVKKALLFLESKIKQIILVISEDEENQKDALLTKKQLKCISCDKELDKFSGVISSPKGNWDGLPYKDHPAEILGRFGMTNFGSLSKKIKKLEGKDLPILNKRNVNQSFQNNS